MSNYGSSNNKENICNINESNQKYSNDMNFVVQNNNMFIKKPTLY